jgi:hypothetical protein
MPPRDPIKTARNQLVAKMKGDLRKLLPKVLKTTDFQTEASLNATIGSEADEYIDLYHQVILSPEQYVTCYMKGFKASMSPIWYLYPNAHRNNYDRLKQSKQGQQYFMLFLKRSYLKHFDELSRTRPHISQSEIWIGQNNASYGLLVTPRFNKVHDEWENDRSEIRHFPELYWTIGHVLYTGFVIPDEQEKVAFGSVDEYLTFFKNVLVRASGSEYEKDIAKRYVEFVRNAKDPKKVPLLIPELATKERSRSTGIG